MSGEGRGTATVLPSARQGEVEALIPCLTSCGALMRPRARRGIDRMGSRGPSATREARGDPGMTPPGEAKIRSGGRSRERREGETWLARKRFSLIWYGLGSAAVSTTAHHSRQGPNAFSAGRWSDRQRRGGDSRHRHDRSLPPSPSRRIGLLSSGQVVDACRRAGSYSTRACVIVARHMSCVRASPPERRMSTPS